MINSGFVVIDYIIRIAITKVAKTIEVATTNKVIENSVVETTTTEIQPQILISGFVRIVLSALLYICLRRLSRQT